jgi:hypothetical protein
VFFATSMVSLSEHGAGLTVGTMSLIRRRALVEAGGWAEWCLTEDPGDRAPRPVPSTPGGLVARRSATANRREAIRGPGRPPRGPWPRSSEGPPDGPGPRPNQVRRRVNFPWPGTPTPRPCARASEYHAAGRVNFR